MAGEILIRGEILQTSFRPRSQGYRNNTPVGQTPRVFLNYILTFIYL